MHVVGRTTAVLLLALFAGQGAIPAAHAAASAKSTCARAEQHGKRCLAAHRAASQRAIRRVALGWPRRRAALGWSLPSRRNFSGDPVGISQLSPRLRPRSVSRLRFDSEDRSLCGGYGDRSQLRAPCQRNLADAVLQSPDASTQKILREMGIPIIPDVPPIVILRSGTERRPTGLFDTGLP